MTTLAMPVTLDGPLPSPPEHSLLSIPGVVVPGDGHWLSGATIYPYPVDEPQTWEPCSVGTFRTKDDGTGVPLPQFSPFVSYLPITCSAMGIGDPNEFRDRAEKAMDAVISFTVEQALSQGVDQSPNPFFTDGNETTPAGATAVSVQAGVGYLEHAIGLSGRQGLLHMPPSVVAAAGFNYLREEENEGPVVTANGTPVACGGGYIGAHRLGHTAPSIGQAWCFATGPVEVRMSNFELLDISEVLDRSTNDVTFRAERYVLAVWDTAIQAAVLIDWTL